MTTSFSQDELADLPQRSNGSVIRPPGTGRRGPVRRILNKLEQTELVALLRNGYGRELACSRLGIPTSCFRNTWKTDAEFRTACHVAQKTAEQALGEQAYQLASQGNTDILMKLLDRFDRGHRLKVGRIEAEKNRQLRMNLAKLVLEHKASNPSLVLALVPIISEACHEAVGAEQASLILETLVRRLDDVIPAVAPGPERDRGKAVTARTNGRPAVESF